jgi:cysteine desulfurase
LLLDANASVPAVPEAKAALVAALDVEGNPSSPHAMGRAARRVLDEAREAVAAALGGQAKELVLLSGASEANRWLVDALARFGRGKPLRVVTSPLEHPSLAKPLAHSGLDAAVLPSRDGQLVLDEELLVGADVVLCTAAHNETGLVPDLEALCALVSDEAIVCVDAAQAVARLPVLPARVDAIVASAHKIGGHAGAGALLLRGRARRLSAPWQGGGQEGGLRPGTEALALHASFGAAARVVERERALHASLAPLRDRLEREVAAAWGARVIGAGGKRLDNTTALVVEGADGDALRIAIDGAGVCVGFGAACSALAPEPSPSLVALGVAPEDARATVRLSLPARATADDVDEAVRRLGPLARVVERSRQSRRKNRR